MNTSMQQELAPMVGGFSLAAGECLDSLFDQRWELVEQWRVTNELQGSSECLVTLGSGNERFQSLALVALDNATLNQLIAGSDASPDDAVDVFGELLNTWCGALADSQEFKQRFGVLAQSLPMMYVSGHWMLKAIWGVQGDLQRQGASIRFGYAIRDRSRHR